MWKCDPSNIQNCLNCQYADCIKTNKLHDPVSDELDREVRTDIKRANCRELKQFKYDKKRWRKQLELCKGALYGVIGRYYEFFGKEPKVDELMWITGHRRKTIITFIKQLQSEGLLEFNGERIRLVRYWDV